MCPQARWQAVKALVAEPGDSILIPRTHKVEGENRLLQAVLCPSQVCGGMCPQTNVTLNYLCF